MGGKFKQKKNLNKKTGPVTRKEMRKQVRKEKKAKKNNYFKNKNKLPLLKNTAQDMNHGKSNNSVHKNKHTLETKHENKQNIKTALKKEPSFLEEKNKLHKQEMKEKAKLERGMAKIRKKALLEANIGEDKEIKRLEKQLKLNKRKSKSIPKSFAEEGLDFLLEVCDTDKLMEAPNAEINLKLSNSEFEDDFALATGKIKRKATSDDRIPKKKKVADIEIDEHDQGQSSGSKIEILDGSSESDQSEENEDGVNSNDEDLFDDEAHYSDLESDNNNVDYSGESENQSEDHDTENEEIDGEFDDGRSSENSDREDGEEPKNSKSGKVWEDIYGRTRDEKGNVVQAEVKGKYIPPHLREQQIGQDAKRTEELIRLKKQLKGLINRLAESNIYGIANQIDELYMRNSRNDMNDSLLSLVTEALVGRVLTADRLVMEHTLLIAVLHANVGMEVGAHFLQSFVEKFDSLYNEGQDVEDKAVDNLLLIISHMYNFKMFHSVLMYNILDRLVSKFSEKEVDLILLVLRSVGFSLRKDDPLALKDLVLRLQKKANESSHLRDNPRVRFMLDILLAVKNNNMAKIPHYDPSLSEHLKKLLKTLVHKGKYVTELKITLEDLLKVEERGRWWIVGSAWSGAPSADTGSKAKPTQQQAAPYSQAVLELAHKQRMNTDNRRNVFCILMSAEDYLDAFEKLLRLGLKAQQEQEIFHVMVHCLLQEKSYNPYYAHLATHFCQADRKHQMTIQYHLWDKFKELSNLSQNQITNLAKFLAHLFLEKALAISALKVMQFSEMDKPCVRLLRQILLSLLLSDSEETVAAVFSRVSRPEKLHMFRESLRLFLHHFVLRNVSDLLPEQAVKLKERVKLAEIALTSADTKRFL